MRILILSNFYPPFAYGGMELTCQAVVEGLKRRGHHTFVLTSRFGCSKPVVTEDVARCLFFEMDFAAMRNAVDFFFLATKREKYDRYKLQSSIADTKPDVIFIWGMWNLPRVLAKDAEDIMSGRVLYRFGDYWPTLPSQHIHYWLEPGKSAPLRLAKALLRPLAMRSLRQKRPVKLRYPNSYCISHAVKRQLLDLDVPVSQARVIYNGIDTELYDRTRSTLQQKARDLTKLLYIGRLMPEKGPHLAIEALATASKQNASYPGHLSLAGTGSRQYVAELQALVASRNLSERVSFLGAVPMQKIPSLLHEHGVLIVPSQWEEPFGRVVIEGMAAGCVVIGSSMGAIPEIISHRETGLLFSPEDVNEAAQHLEELLVFPDLGHHLADNGRRWAKEKFNLGGMVDEVENLLSQITVSDAAQALM